MKEISIHQAWATLVVHGLKTVELQNHLKKYKPVNLIPGYFYALLVRTHSINAFAFVGVKYKSLSISIPQDSN